MGEKRPSRDLFAAFRQNEEAAIQEWVVRFSGPLYTLAFRYTQIEKEAEDIVQETLLRAVQSFPLKDMDRDVKPWLMKVALNLCRDWSRKRREETFADLPGGQVEDVRDDSGDPQREVEDQETRASLLQAIHRLPITERVVLTLKYNDDLSYEEIAEVTGLPVQTVGTHLFRGRQRVKQWIDGLESE